MFTDEVMHSGFIHVMFSLILRLPSSLSDSLPQVMAAGDQMKRTVALSQLVGSSGFEHGCEHLG